MTDTITKQEPDLSVAPRGHWRNVWTCPPKWQRHAAAKADSEPWTPGARISKRRWPTLEMAEQHVTEWREYNAMFGVLHVSTEYFPEGDEQ